MQKPSKIVNDTFHTKLGAVIKLSTLAMHAPKALNIYLCYLQQVFRIWPSGHVLFIKNAGAINLVEADIFVQING